MDQNPNLLQLTNQINQQFYGSSVRPTVSAETSFKGFLFGVALIICLLIFIFAPDKDIVIVWLIITLILWGIIISGIKIPNQWEVLAVFFLGRFKVIKPAGLNYIIPFFEYGIVVDMRVLTLDIPKQSVITKDNVPIEIDGVLFFKVENAEKALIDIQDYRYAVKEYSKNSLRDVVGGLTLDEVLAEREKIQEDIRIHIQDKVKEWGLHADSIRLKDIQMPEDLKRVMSRQASAEREKRATIIKAEGDKLASVNLSQAAQIMNENPGAMQLRTLQTIDGLGCSASNTVLLFPIDVIELFRTINKEHTENKDQ